VQTSTFGVSSDRQAFEIIARLGLADMDAGDGGRDVAAQRAVHLDVVREEIEDLVDIAAFAVVPVAVGAL
jgi:hypothetical protein